MNINQFHFKNKVVVLCSLLILSGIQILKAQVSPEPKPGFYAGLPVKIASPQASGLLFYLSGNQEFKADNTAGGQELPNFNSHVTLIPDGFKGPGFRAEDDQLLSYWAPGNIYAQRGTVSFFWRSRYPVGTTPFPIFRVGFADHSSWDMTWLRIDYNGSGFDAFVTDVGLSRTRISWPMEQFPGPAEWIHLALSWDETEGIRFYVNGELVANQSVNGTVYDSGLDQFGTHSRIISPYQVQSAYCFQRGGDFDELCLFDRMLPDAAIAGLAKGDLPENLPAFARNLKERKWRDEWGLRNGWNLPNSPPPLLPAGHTMIRKVEIPDAMDITRWYWKANDGIRETTWPGVYNMSRLPGRYDYFVLPDWDCYSGSGQSVRFKLPEEPWNHLEMWGTAWGQLTLERSGKPDTTFAVRSQKQLKSWHRPDKTEVGGIIRFDNALIEEPIGSFDAYFVDQGGAPKGSGKVSFTLVPASVEFQDQLLSDLAAFVRGRYPADEQQIMTTEGITGKNSRIHVPVRSASLPIIHVLLPIGDHAGEGLDGIEVQLPPLNVKPTHGEVFPLNIRVKDPLWPMRDLADFSFSVKPGDSPTLWIDTRDRILPEGRGFYLTLAGAGEDFSPELLTGTRVSLVFKSKTDTKKEHAEDRFRQVRDLYAHVVEEHPVSPRLNLYNRMIADCNDLLKSDPGHWLGQAYRYAITGSNKPEYKLPECPAGTPEWAFLQIEFLKKLEGIANFYIDKRQIANGEFGGGLSDDGDLTNMWPGIAFLGINPDKMLNSLRLHMTSYFDQDRPPFEASLRQRSLPLFTNGLATIFTDELHALEDGIQVVGQLQLLDYGNPLYMEKGMLTARRLLNDVTQINPAGHRHFRSRYYSGMKIATEDPWQWSVNRSYLVLHPSYMTAWYNGNPDLKKMITGLADGLLAHRKDGRFITDIQFSTDEARNTSGAIGGGVPSSLFTAAHRLSGDPKYLGSGIAPVSGRKEFDRDRISASYRNEITNLGVREYINTEGSVWIDRLSPFSPVIQRDRLGGIALIRTSILYPEHFVSWKFNAPASYRDVAVFVSKAGPDSLELITYNLSDKPVSADMTLWNIIPGKWKIRQGGDRNEDLKMDNGAVEKVEGLRQGESVSLQFAPGAYTLLSLTLVQKADKGNDQLPDIGIGPSDVKREGNKLIVRVHSLGTVDSPQSNLVVKDKAGKILAKATVPAMEAPLDLLPRWKEVEINLPEGILLSGGSVEVDPEHKIEQITRRNDWVKW